MASIIYSNSGKVGYNLKEYLVDTTADMADLPYDLPLGTKAFNIAENQWYMYDSSHNWVEINEGGGGGGDSKKGYPAYNSKVEDYLYQSYYPTLDYDNAYQIFKEEGDFPALGACSALRKDNLFGRNLDWYYSNQVDFIVKTPHTDSYRATIGIAGGIEELTKDFVESGESSELYKLVPFRLQDGINESGVVACMNVVPTDYGKNVAIPTEEEEVEICSRMLVRYILDNFDTALEAVNYVKKHCKVYFAKSLHDINYEVHIMVADENATFILEFVDGATEIIDVTSDAPYMTNFHRYGVTLNGDNTVETPATGDAIETNGITEYGAGLERFNIIANDYDTKSVREILEEIKYTNTYTLTEDVWYSEFVGGDLKVNSAVEDFIEIVELARQAYEDRSRDEAITWHTTHAVIYDLDSKNAIIRTQEGITDYTDSSNPSIIISNQDITVTENGVYSAAAGYTGLGIVTVEVPSTEYVAGAGIDITNGVISNTYSDVDVVSQDEGVTFNVGVESVNVPTMTDHNHIYTGYTSESNIIDNKRVNGGVVSDSQYTYITDDFIEILPNTSYTLQGEKAETMNAISFYDENKTFISENHSGMSSSKITATSPSNAKYILGTFLKANTPRYNGYIQKDDATTPTKIFEAKKGAYVEGLADKPTGTKATVVSSASTDSEIPTAKAVYDLFNSIVDVTSVTW